MDDTLAQELARATPSTECYIAVGVFDGIHQGHRHLLRILEREAGGAGCQPGVVTFRNHPRTVLSPEVKIPQLVGLEERIRLIQAVDIRVVVPITFTLEVSRVRARDFVALLQEHVRMRGLVMGPDFTLGFEREGTPEVLRDLGREMGFSVTVVEPFLQGDIKVSSTSIRNALAEGDVETTHRFLGHPFALEGTVIHGAGRGGSQLGYPTANIAVPPNMALPGDGIYATRALLGERWYRAATSIGVRPTFGAGERTIEAFLLDFEGDLYGQPVRLEFIQRLRDEALFESLETLRAQMARDVARVRELLAG